MRTSGWGSAAASLANRAGSSSSAIGCSFQNSAPDGSMARSITTGFCSTGWAVTWGTLMRIEWLSRGAVMMKITSSTSITSINGTMLISDMVVPGPLESKLPNAMSGSPVAGQADGPAVALVAAVGHLLAGGQEGEQVVRKSVELRQIDPVDAHEGVVGQHGGNGDRQAQPGHDQRLAHRAGDAVDGDAIGHADAQQGVVHPPHRAEQAHERRGRPHGRQHRQAVFQASGFLIDDLADGARDEGRRGAA